MSKPEESYSLSINSVLHHILCTVTPDVFFSGEGTTTAKIASPIGVSVPRGSKNQEELLAMHDQNDDHRYSRYGEDVRSYGERDERDFRHRNQVRRDEDNVTQSAPYESARPIGNYDYGYDAREQGQRAWNRSSQYRQHGYASDYYGNRAGSFVPRDEESFGSPYRAQG